jgi:hypothetical protein
MYRKIIIAVFMILVVYSSARALEPKTREFEFNYSFTVNSIPEGSKEVSIWVPIPQNTDYQEISDINIDAKAEFDMNTGKAYKNKMMYAKVLTTDAGAIPVNISFKVRRAEMLGKLAKKGGAPDEEDMSIYLGASSLVTLSDRVKKISAGITKGGIKTIDKARAIYEYVFDKMEYDKSGEGWGRGDTEYACDVSKGNCTDFHSLFISLARAAGIPARFKIGFPVPASGNVGGYHCWAEFYDDVYGWVPVDISEAKKNPQRKNYFYGNICENRVEFTMERDILLNPPQAGEKLNFFVYPYVEIDGILHSMIDKKFSIKNL